MKVLVYEYTSADCAFLYKIQDGVKSRMLQTNIYSSIQQLRDATIEYIVLEKYKKYKHMKSVIICYDLKARNFI